MIATSKHAQSGFSLMELLAYTVIVGLLVAGAAVLITNLQYGAKVTNTEQAMNLIKTSIDKYYARNDEYPKTLKDLIPKYLKSIPKDGWGNAFVYKVTEGEKRAYKLESYGSEGPGGGGKRLSVWDK